MNKNDDLEYICCNLCSSSSSTALFVAKDWFLGSPEEFTIVRCDRCGFVYLNPRPKKEKRAEYYPRDYYTHRNGSINNKVSNPTKNAQTMIKKAAKHSIYQKVYPEDTDALRSYHGGLGSLLLAMFRSRMDKRGRWGLIGKQGRLLDVGCGNGRFLYAIKHDWLIGQKIQVMGIDIDSRAIEAARSNGLNVTVADSENIPFPDEYFNIITMRHSLEHMSDPLKTLCEVHRVVRCGGALIIEVPNVDSIGAKVLKDKWAGTDVPRHLLHFTPTTLRKLLEESGLCVRGFKKWRGTFKREISVRNMEKYWDSIGLAQAEITIRRFALKCFLAALDYVYLGGTVSVEAYKPGL